MSLFFNEKQEESILKVFEAAYEHSVKGNMLFSSTLVTYEAVATYFGVLPTISYRVFSALVSLGYAERVFDEPLEQWHYVLTAEGIAQYEASKEMKKTI